MASENKLVILHTTYGCDSGCCGHMVEVRGYYDSRKFGFEFAHAASESPEDKRTFAVEMVGVENIDDVDFEASNIPSFYTC